MARGADLAWLKAKLLHYRSQAQQLRALAEEIEDAESQERMMKEAAEYDGLALIVQEKIAAAAQPQG
jgi:hypothetical protein